MRQHLVVICADCLSASASSRKVFLIKITTLEKYSSTGEIIAAGEARIYFRSLWQAMWTHLFLKRSFSFSARPAPFAPAGQISTGRRPAILSAIF